MSDSRNSPIIGIDLGTTNSLCSFFEGNTPVLIPNAHGKLLTPSVVGVLDDAQIIVGSPAKELQIYQPEKCAACFKRNMGTDYKYQLGSYEFNATELSSIVLKSLKEDAERHLGIPIFEAIITVPAYFNDNQRKTTKLAGELAGLKVSRVINEPTSAALCYGHRYGQTDQRLLVFDLGGGTFDVTIMEVFEGSLEIISTAGECALGGHDFTEKIMAELLHQAGMNLEIEELKNPRRVSRLTEECNRAKHLLSTQDEVSVTIPTDDGELLADCKKISFSNSQLTKICEPLIQRIIRPISRALRDAKCTPDMIDKIILVGGATRMSLTHDIIRKFFGKEPWTGFNPDQVVALGAAIQSALMQDNEAVDDLVMTDVCPHTLGVSIVKHFNHEIRDGYFLPIIHRNTTIPVSREEVVNTISHNQRELLVEVFQGESRKNDGNLKLGELKIKNVPPGPAGQPIQIRFTYDMNGILEVEVTFPSTGRREVGVLVQEIKSLTQSEIDDALQKMQKLKYYPKDHAENHNLLCYAERCLAEVDRSIRNDLEILVDQYEISMNSGDAEFFLNTKERLIQVLDALGFSYNLDEDSGSDENF